MLLAYTQSHSSAPLSSQNGSLPQPVLSHGSRWSKSSDISSQITLVSRILRRMNRQLAGKSSQQSEPKGFCKSILDKPNGRPLQPASSVESTKKSERYASNILGKTPDLKLYSTASAAVCFIFRAISSIMKRKKRRKANIQISNWPKSDKCAEYHMVCQYG